MIRLTTVLLIALLVSTQYSLWLGKGGLLHVWNMNYQVRAAYNEIQKIKIRNTRLNLEIRDLRQGKDMLEELARTDLGMLKKDEIFLQIVNCNDNKQRNIGCNNLR